MIETTRYAGLGADAAQPSADAAPEVASPEGATEDCAAPDPDEEGRADGAAEDSAEAFLPRTQAPAAEERPAGDEEPAPLPEPAPSGAPAGAAAGGGGREEFSLIGALSDAATEPESSDSELDPSWEESIPYELTALRAIQEHDGEASRASRQVVILVPEGVCEDRKVRVLLSNMQLELLVPEGAEAGDIAACELPAVAPLESGRQKRILQDDILMTQLKWFKTEEQAKLRCDDGGTLSLPPAVKIQAAWYGSLTDEEDREDVTEVVRGQYESGVCDISACGPLLGGRERDAPGALEVAFVKDGYMTDEVRKQKKLEAYRLLRGRLMGPVFLPISERECSASSRSCSPAADADADGLPSQAQSVSAAGDVAQEQVEFAP